MSREPLENPKDFSGNQEHPKGFPQKFSPLIISKDHHPHRAPQSLPHPPLTRDLAQVGTRVLLAVGPEAHVASVGTVQVGHTPVQHAEQHHGCQDDEDETPGSQDELAVLLP